MGSFSIKNISVKSDTASCSLIREIFRYLGYDTVDSPYYSPAGFVHAHELDFPMRVCGRSYPYVTASLSLGFVISVKDYASPYSDYSIFNLLYALFPDTILKSQILDGSTTSGEETEWYTEFNPVSSRIIRSYRWSGYEPDRNVEKWHELCIGCPDPKLIKMLFKKSKQDAQAKLSDMLAELLNKIDVEEFNQADTNKYIKEYGREMTPLGWKGARGWPTGWDDWKDLPGCNTPVACANHSDTDKNEDKIHTMLVGMTHVNTGENTENRHEIIYDLLLANKLNAGQELRLVQEDNPYDAHAVAVFGPDGRQLGYLSKRIARQVFDDNGRQLGSLSKRIVRQVFNDMGKGIIYKALVTNITSGGDSGLLYNIYVDISVDEQQLK